MKRSVLLVTLIGGALLHSNAQTTWISTSNSTYTTATNWSNGLPSTGPQLAIFPDSATIQHTIDITGTTARNALGLRFDLFSAGAGFAFGSSANNSPGFQNRATDILGTGASILNNDDSTQTFNVPVWMFTNIGGTGAGAAQKWIAAAGPMVFSGIMTTRSTVNNNGGLLTIDGAFDTTIGIPGAANGDIIGAGGLTKIGTGTLKLGGTLANVYAGRTTITDGTILADKNNAFGTGPLTLGGGILNTGGLSHSLGALDVDANSIINFGLGTSALAFADSDSQDWGGFTVTIQNWTAGVDTLRFGTDGTGFNSQLSLIRFADFGNATGQIDSNGFVSPVPEPASGFIALLGGISLLTIVRRRK
jgi:fibronectin-binding autotransporter adhesin